ncbi:NAD/FAD-dependent oxidoreductase [Subtercola sp. Z020]|uniref:NAD(P)/FAD-dependent oxidoreductase n=1 Tax=Subtercola sp. Z020 TaxID=2080582 RepID=UPI000CE8EA98|nr:FAD-dependent oxidoreductase [Subtercola sp. Z020]PPF79074.1 NAD/FAD-dependent oxidoreductase [Subtercola sp. Z020]
MTTPAPSPSVLVVGAGISGLACARALHDRGVSVRVVDRGRVVGGRLATKRLDARPVDTGARYFTVPNEADSGFRVVVDDWLDRGLARPWTDTFDAIAADGSRTTKQGPLRFAAPAGLRSLTSDLDDRLRADGVAVDLEHEITSVSESGEVDGIQYDHVVLAMPDPQAKRMLAPDSPAGAELVGADGWQPTLSVALAWAERQWPQSLHGIFVDDSPVLAFVADDGDRRGDAAPVLVAHTTADFAREHLAHPDSGIAPVVAAVRALLGISTEPTSTLAHRWSFSSPAAQHDGPYLLAGRIAVCGDAWGARSAVPTAWASGTALGEDLAEAR